MPHASEQAKPNLEPPTARKRDRERNANRKYKYKPRKKKLQAKIDQIEMSGDQIITLPIKDEVT